MHTFDAVRLCGLRSCPPTAPGQRVRSDGRQSPRRAPNRLGYQEIRRDHPPLPHREIWASRQILAAADPLPDDLCNDELAKIGHATALVSQTRVLIGERRFRGSGSATRRRRRPYRAVAGKLHIPGSDADVYAHLRRRRHCPSSPADGRELTANPLPR
jgi:hypothetical protein